MAHQIDRFFFFERPETFLFHFSKHLKEIVFSLLTEQGNGVFCFLFKKFPTEV